MRRHFVGISLLAAGIAVPLIPMSRHPLPEAHGSVGPSSSPPQILAAYYGYNNCIGIPDLDGQNGNINESQARGCRTAYIPGTTTLVSNTSLPQFLSSMCLPTSVSSDKLQYLDGMPVTFSGPVASASVTIDAFTITLSDGSIRKPTCVSLNPSNEPNEIETVLLMGDFGEPSASGKPYPKTVTVSGVHVLTSSGSTMPVNASIAVMDYSTGPKLLGAKLAPFSASTQGTTGRGMPNHCQINFPTTTHVLQLLWSGGVTRDGVNSILPNEPGLFKTASASGLFSIKVRLPNGTQDHYYKVNGVQILGMADLGNGQPTPGQFWGHDSDNYLEICLALPAGFDLSTLTSVLTDPNNSAGLKLYDPTGDTPNAAQTVAITR